jgi:NaMN:DMB phosphoribosyltransferase
MNKHKKMIASLIFSAVSASCQTVSSLSYEIVNIKQIGLADGYDEKGFVGSKIFAIEIKVTAKGQSTTLKAGYTVSERTENAVPTSIIIGDIIHDGTTNAAKEIAKLNSIGLSKEDLEFNLKQKYKKVIWN